MIFLLKCGSLEFFIIINYSGIFLLKIVKKQEFSVQNTIDEDNTVLK